MAGIDRLNTTVNSVNEQASLATVLMREGHAVEPQTDIGVTCTSDVLKHTDINPNDVMVWLAKQPNAYGTLYSENVLRTYMSALHNAPQKLMLQDSINRNVFGCNTVAQLDKLWSKFKMAANYADVNRIQWHGQLSAGLAAFKRYLEHLERDNTNKNESITQIRQKQWITDSLNATANTTAINIDCANEESRILDAFKAEFPISMDLGFVDLERLKTKHESLYGHAFVSGDEHVYSLIRNNGIKVDSNRYTHIDHLMSADTLQKIKEFLDTELAKISVYRVYSKPLFDTFKAVFSFAMNEELLLDIIDLAFANEYKTNRRSMFITRKDNASSPNINDEIKNAVVKLLAEEIQPFSADEIASRLPSYPKWRVESVLSSELQDIIAISRNKYAHIDYVYMEQDNINKIKDLIASRIAAEDSMSEDDLYAKISEDIHDVIGLNPEISKSDILKVIKRKLGEAFTIKFDWQSGTRFLPKEGV
jgi:hypothetical protein